MNQNWSLYHLWIDIGFQELNQLIRAKFYNIIPVINIFILVIIVLTISSCLCNSVIALLTSSSYIHKSPSSLSFLLEIFLVFTHGFSHWTILRAVWWSQPNVHDIVKEKFFLGWLGWVLSWVWKNCCTIKWRRQKLL